MDELTANDPKPRSRPALRRVGAAAAVGVGLTLGAAGIAAAAGDPSPSPSGSATVQPPQNAPGMPGRRPGPGGPRGERGMAMGEALHGEFVVRDGTGFRTVRVQRGTVKSVSNDALTVTSADGFTARYVLTKATLVDAGRDGIATVTKGETVGVEATVSKSAVTATHVRDITKLKAERRNWGPGRRDDPNRPARPGGAPNATPPSGAPAVPGSYGDGADAEGA